MRRVTLLWASLVGIFGLTSAILWHDLRQERKHSFDLTQRLSAVEARLSAALLETRPPISTEKPIATMPTQPAAQKTAEAVAPRKLVNSMSGRPNPDSLDRESRIARARQNVAQRYPALIEFLGLSGVETDRLYDRLAEYQVDSAPTQVVVNGQVDQKALKAAQQMAKERALDFDRSLALMLGPARFEKWEEYKPTRTARIRAAQLERSVSNAGGQLSDQQSKNFAAAVIAEDQRQQQEIRSKLGSSTTPSEERAAQQVVNNIQVDSNRRIVEAARSYLSPDQLQRLDAVLSQQAQQ